MREKLHGIWRERTLREWAEWALLAALAGLLLWKGVAVGWARLDTDFPNYYLAARLLREGYSLDRIYDWVWLARVKDHWGLDAGHVGFVGLTPFSAWALWPLAGWSALSAKRIWLLLNLIFLGASAELLHRASGSDGLGRRRTWLICLLAVLPLRSDFAFGQMHLLVLLLMVMAFYLERRGRPVACGVCLGLAGALKVYPLGFAAYFAWKRRWRELAGLAGCTAVVLLLGYWWIGGGAVGEFVHETLGRTMQGEIVDPYNVHAASMSALLHRLLVREPELNPFPLVGARWLFAVLYPLWQAAVLLPVFAMLRVGAFTDKDGEALEWAAMVAVLLMISPVPASYHFVVLIAAVVPLVDVLRRRGQGFYAAIAVVLYVLICWAHAPNAEAEHFSLGWVTSCNRLWLQMLLWAGVGWYLWRERGVWERLRADRRWAAMVLVPFVLFWVWGVVSNERHFSGWDVDFARRIALPEKTLLATSPVARRGGFLYTAMVDGGGYAVVDESGAPVKADADADTLTAAVHVAGRAETMLVEVAGKTESKLVQVPEARPEMVEVLSRLEDAESPVFSADGAWLAYLHEEHGRGSLWAMHAQGGQAERATLVELVSRGGDVRGATFLPSGDVLFAGTVDGKEGIYSIPAARSHEAAPFLVGSERVDAPAVSPDGRRVAFRTRVGYRWQLTVMDLSTRVQRRMTEGDCDAYAPAWLDRSTVIYATDCGRAVGLTALAKVRVE